MNYRYEKLKYQYIWEAQKWKPLSKQRNKQNYMSP